MCYDLIYESRQQKTCWIASFIIFIQSGNVWAREQELNFKLSPKNRSDWTSVQSWHHLPALLFTFAGNPEKCRSRYRLYPLLRPDLVLGFTTRRFYNKNKIAVIKFSIQFRLKLAMGSRFVTQGPMTLFLHKVRLRCRKHMHLITLPVNLRSTGKQPQAATAVSSKLSLPAKAEYVVISPWRCNTEYSQFDTRSHPLSVTPESCLEYTLIRFPA